MRSPVNFQFLLAQHAKCSDKFLLKIVNLQKNINTIALIKSDNSILKYEHRTTQRDISSNRFSFYSDIIIFQRIFNFNYRCLICLWLNFVDFLFVWLDLIQYRMTLKHYKRVCVTIMKMFPKERQREMKNSLK